MKRLYLLITLATIALPASAHEVHVSARTESVTVVTLTYANGKPFAYEQFEVTPEGTDAPSQVGRTDAIGRAAVLSLPGKALTLTASSKDGHGARLLLPATAPGVAAGATNEMPRWLLITAGAGILFGLFGLIQLFLPKQRKPTP